ncbi:MAG: outer membrane protein assembly factor BamA [Bacteroidaceae bacterium]|nr:outer membrane protein assembly factor BamA [Bacteroidaceae bacterium]
MNIEVKRIYLIIYSLFGLLLPLLSQVVQREVAPEIDYSRSPRQYYIGDITIDGVKNYDDYLLIGLSGLSKGQRIEIPGEEITKAVKRYWRNGLFSNVAIRVDSLVGDSAYLHIQLTQRPRISEVNINGVRKNERDDLKEKMGLVRDNQLTPNMIDRAKILAKRYFSEKGYKNAEINIVQRDDAGSPDRIIVDVNVEKKDKVKIHRIHIIGNNNLSTKKIKGNLFKPGVLKKIHDKRSMSGWFRSKKFVESKYKEAKENLLTKYGEMGYRDAIIVADSIVPYGEKEDVDIYISVEEGQKYYLRNIEWVGNTLYPTEMLAQILHMKKGDVYNQKLLDDRLQNDDDAVSNLYYNNGYVFSRTEAVETNIVGDSVDLEVRIFEGQQAYISHVRISGNDRVYENVVRRELRNKPGDLFSKEALIRSYREIATLGHFDENIDPKVEPDRVSGTVDINWGLTSKGSDQIEFSLGYGQTGIVGRIGLKFTNFCMANIFKGKGLRRGVMPMGNSETFSISGQTNGRYYQSYSVSYMNPWFGGKRPNTFSLGAFFMKQTDVSDNYYNSAYYNNYYSNYLYGLGNSSYNYYENYYDPGKYMMLFGLSVGWGKRLRWPDDWFSLSAELSYQRYMLKNWQYFLMSNGNCNNINLGLTLSRNSSDNPIYPRKGSEFMLNVTFTPPYSLFDGKDYANLATNSSSPTFNKEMQEKYRWIEYHKWKFKSRTFTALTGGNKCFVLMTRVEFGILGHYTKNKRSPFETYYVGGDGTSGYSSNYATETIGMRGYDNGALTPRGQSGYAYDRFSVELRYPFILSNSTNIYGLVFAEGGNAWNEIKDFNPFDMKRSAGAGVRIFLPMVGLLGIDWAYGFDSVFGSKTYAGSHFHFILGQEF